MKQSLLAIAAMVVLAAGCAKHPGNVSTAVEGKYPYTKPLTSLGAKFGALPIPVQNTVRSEVGIQDISEVVKDSTADKVYYRIYFKDPANFPPLFVAADGSVLKPDLTVAVPAPQDSSGGLASAPPVTVTGKEVPESVMKVVHEQAPGLEPATISKEVWGNHVVYVISFKEEDKRPKLFVEADGTLLQHAPK